MTGLPVAGYFTDGARTNAEAKTAQDDMLAANKETLGGAAISLLTIATGNVTPIGPVHNIDTEGAASSDDLANILQTNHPAGRMLLIRNTDNAREVVVKHNATGAGEVLLADSADYSMDNVLKWLWLLREGTAWIEVLRGFGADTAAFRSFLGLGTAAVLNSGTAAGNLPTNTNLEGTVREFTRRQNFNATTLSDGATINWDLDLNQVTAVTLGGNRTFAAPTNMVDGSFYALTVIQDGTGTRVPVWNAVFKWPGGTAPVLTTAINARDYLVFRSNGTNLYLTGISLDVK